MNTNVNLSAALGVLGLLGACFVLAVLGLAAMHALVVRRYGRAKVSVLGLALVAAAYAGEGHAALATEAGVGMPLDTPLRPGESYTTGLVFDLPPGARDPALLLNESSPETRFIVGHENSPLHGKTEFRL